MSLNPLQSVLSYSDVNALQFYKEEQLVVQNVSALIPVILCVYQEQITDALTSILWEGGKKIFNTSSGKSSLSIGAMC